MIDTVHIRNFRCLRDVKVELGPFTVLIGPNDSGKTSFLDAIHLLGRTTKGDLGKDFANAAHGTYPEVLRDQVWHRAANLNLQWKIRGIASGPFNYELELVTPTGATIETIEVENKPNFNAIKTGESFQYVADKYDYGGQVQKHLTLLYGLAQFDAKKNVSYAPMAALAEAVSSTEKYQLNAAQMRVPAASSPSPMLHPTGDNLSAVLNEMLAGPDRATIIELERKLHEAVPTLRGISTPTARNGQGNLRSLEYTLSEAWKPPVTIPASQVSDGAILLTAFLALAYGDTPNILLIEEPENGLHPSRLKTVIELLRKISTGEIGNKARQVILTTHSPILLNFVEPNEVRIFKRDDEGATQVTSMDKVPEIDRLLKEFAPGELWYLFGEEKLLEGQPA